MSIKNILVAFNSTEGAKTALSIGCLMARKYDAHLTGILTHGFPSAFYTLGNRLPEATKALLKAADDDHRADVQKDFDSQTANLDHHKTHFLDIFGEADEKLVEVARVFDLIIMAQPDKTGDFQHMEVHADVIARNAGRPVLVVPKHANTDNIAQNALIAWDAKRAASRAMSDSLRILETGARVCVLTISTRKMRKIRVQPVLDHLARHDINGHAIHKEKGKGQIADIILQTAAQEQAGMIVMGAYEHSKFAEDLFGGVTNTILRDTTIPVLLSH